MCGGIQPEFLRTLKSAIPLIAIGVSYISLIFTVQRTKAQRFLGFLVGLAFILWGAEQFMSNQGWISFIDDIVVFLFVLDLSIVVRENLKRSSGGDSKQKPTLGT
jgi:Ca2+/Na+ antiporter